MAYDLENFLGLNGENDNLLIDPEEASETIQPLHELNGKASNLLHQLYFNRGLEVCSKKLESVVCATTEVVLPDNLKDLFDIPKAPSNFLKKFKQEDKEVPQELTVMVALGLDDQVNEKSADLLMTTNGVLVAFHTSSLNEKTHKERKIRQVVKVGGLSIQDETETIASNVWENYNASVKMLKSIDSNSWTTSIVCNSCPVKNEGIR